MRNETSHPFIRPAGAIAITLLLAAAPCQAEDNWKGVYIDAFGGLSMLSGGDVAQSGATSKGSYDRGFLAGLAFGKQVSSAWALEVEWFYRSNEVESMTGGPFAAVTEGDFASTNLMFNAVRTFGGDASVTAASRAITPYVGLGIGFMQEVDIDLTVGGVEQEYSDNWVPAFQVMAGALYPVSGKLSAFVELRYHHAGSPKLDPRSGGATVEADYNGVTAHLGLRHSF